MAATARIIIPLIGLRGVKKTGLLKGVSLRYKEQSPGGEIVEKEERFRWVGGRDELFARLVGVDGRQWTKV